MPGRCDRFGVNIPATTYYSEALGSGRGEAFEQAISTCRVVNVQQNGRIHVGVLAEVATSAELWQRMRNREPAALSQLVVKPSAFSDAAGTEVRFYE